MRTTMRRARTGLTFEDKTAKLIKMAEEMHIKLATEPKEDKYDRAGENKKVLPDRL